MAESPPPLKTRFFFYRNNSKIYGKNEIRPGRIRSYRIHLYVPEILSSIGRAHFECVSRRFLGHFDKNNFDLLQKEEEEVEGEGKMMECSNAPAVHKT